MEGASDAAEHIVDGLSRLQPAKRHMYHQVVQGALLVQQAH